MESPPNRQGSDSQAASGWQLRRTAIPPSGPCRPTLSDADATAPTIAEQKTRRTTTLNVGESRKLGCMTRCQDCAPTRTARRFALIYPRQTQTRVADSFLSQDWMDPGTTRCSHAHDSFAARIRTTHGLLALGSTARTTAPRRLVSTACALGPTNNAARVCAAH